MGAIREQFTFCIAAAVGLALSCCLALAGCASPDDAAGPTGQPEAAASSSGAEAGERAGGPSGQASSGSAAASSAEAGSSTASSSRPSTASMQVADARFGLIAEDYEAMKSSVATSLSQNPRDYTQHVGEMFQMPLLPSGCELVSLTIALNSMGVSTRLTELADNYITVDGDYEWGFIESPYSESGGCLPPALQLTANSYLRDASSPYRAHDLTGSGFDGLEALVECGYPVLIWTTLYLDDPVFDESADWWINEHCVVLYGMDDETVYVSDPIEGYMVYDRDSFASVFEECGNRALYMR